MHILKSVAPNVKTYGLYVIWYKKWFPYHGLKHPTIGFLIPNKGVNDHLISFFDP